MRANHSMYPPKCAEVLSKKHPTRTWPQVLLLQEGTCAKKNNEVGMPFPSASEFFQAQARNMGYQQKAEKSTTIRDGPWRRRHLPIVIEIHLEVHHIPYQMQPIISLRLGPREKHTCNSIMNVIPSGCHIWANTHIYIHIYIYAKYTPSWPHAKWLWTASSTNQSPRPVHLGVIVLPTHEAKLTHRPPHLSDLNGHLAATAGCDNQQSQNTYRETTC